MFGQRCSMQQLCSIQWLLQVMQTSRLFWKMVLWRLRHDFTLHPRKYLSMLNLFSQSDSYSSTWVCFSVWYLFNPIHLHGSCGWWIVPGYNRVDASGRYSSKSFGMGSLWRRVVDWFLRRNAGVEAYLPGVGVTNIPGIRTFMICYVCKGDAALIWESKSFVWPANRHGTWS